MDLMRQWGKWVDVRCKECDVVFQVTDTFALSHTGNGKIVYCPNGCPVTLHLPRKDNVVKLIKQ